MAKAKTVVKKRSATARREIDEAVARIRKERKAVVKRATKAVEAIPAPAGMVDGALAFAARTLKAQRAALVPLLDGYRPKAGRVVKPHSRAAIAVADAYEIAEKAVQSQRKVIRRFFERLEPARPTHAPRAHVAVHAAPRRRATPRPKAKIAS